MHTQACIHGQHITGHQHTHTKEEREQALQYIAEGIDILQNIKRQIEEEHPRPCIAMISDMQCLCACLNNGAMDILKHHIDSCIAAAIQQNDLAAIDALSTAMNLYLKFA